MNGFDEMFADIKGKAVTDCLAGVLIPGIALLTRTPSWGPQGHAEERVYLPLEAGTDQAATIDRITRDYGDAVVCYVAVVEDDPNGILRVWGNHIDGRGKIAEWEIKRNPLRLEAKGERAEAGRSVHHAERPKLTPAPHKVAYHGTRYAEQALQGGLLARYAKPYVTDGEGNMGTIRHCPHIWLARSPEDAAHWGDVLAVNMEGLPGDFEPGEWQGCYHGGDLGPERLKAHKPS